MITDLPIYVYATLFGALVFVLTMFYFSSNKNIKLIIGIILWGSFHSSLVFTGFYKNIN